MKTAILMVVVVNLLTLASRIANADDMSTLQQLLRENENLTVQLDKAKKTQGDIAKAELVTEGADSALKHAQEELQRKGNGLLQAQQDIHSQADATGCPWGTLNSNEAYVASCNAEGARLKAMLQDVQKQGASLQVYAQQLQKERSQLSQRTLDWFAKKKANNADLEDLEAERTAWNHRYKAFLFQSQTYERLKVMTPSAQICEQVTDLPAAKGCLDKIWQTAP
jgi:predicted secreted protein